MKSKLLFFLGWAVAAHASNYVGEQTFTPPYTVTEPVNVIGNVTLAAPGIYSAAMWNIVGNLRFGAPGDYTLVASSGSISLTGQLVGPSGGHATLHVNYRNVFNQVGVTTGNVTLVDDAHQTIVPPVVVVTPAASAPLTNLSMRITLNTGASANAGFVVGGTTPRRVLLRAVGPGLAAFGVANPLADPTLTLFNGAGPLAANDNWDGDADTLAAFAAAGAFALTPGSKDAAQVLTLGPGAYTITVRGAAATDAGEVLVEVYLVE